MSIELQSPMKALFRMYKPVTVVLTSAISILCVQQKAIADDHVRIDKPAHETSDVLLQGVYGIPGRLKYENN